MGEGLREGGGEDPLTLWRPSLSPPSPSLPQCGQPIGPLLGVFCGKSPMRPSFIHTYIHTYISLSLTLSLSPSPSPSLPLSLSPSPALFDQVDNRAHVCLVQVVTVPQTINKIFKHLRFGFRVGP